MTQCTVLEYLTGKISEETFIREGKKFHFACTPMDLLKELKDNREKEQ